MSSGSLGVADIVGVAVGGVLALATIVGLAVSFYAMCCRKKQPQQVYPQHGQYPPYQQPYGGGYGQQMNTGYYQQYPQQQPPPSYSAVTPGASSYGKY